LFLREKGHYAVFLRLPAATVNTITNKFTAPSHSQMLIALLSPVFGFSEFSGFVVDHVVAGPVVVGHVVDGRVVVVDHVVDGFVVVGLVVVGHVVDGRVVVGFVPDGTIGFVVVVVVVDSFGS